MTLASVPAELEVFSTKHKILNTKIICSITLQDNANVIKRK